MELTEYLVPLDQAELLEVAQRLAALSRDRDAAAKLFAELSAEHKAKIKELNGLIKFMTEILTTGRDLREVPLMICFNEPEPGKKTLKNAETGRIYEVLDIEPGDLDDLFSAQAIRSSTPEVEEPEEPEEPEEAVPADDPAEEVEDGTMEHPFRLQDITAPGKLILLREGKWYHFKGVTALAVGKEPLGCQLCPFECSPNADCGADRHFRPAGWGFDDSEWSRNWLRERGVAVDPEPGESCSRCGASKYPLFHFSDHVPECQNCLDAKNGKRQEEISELAKEKAGSGNPLLFRGDWGVDAVKKKDLSRFRFRSDKGGWGNPVYFPGNYRIKDTPAAMYRQRLIELGAKED